MLQIIVQHLLYFYSFHRNGTQLSIFLWGLAGSHRKFLVLKPYSHFITLSSESSSTHTGMKSNLQQMLAVASDFLLHYFWTSPRKHWTNCTRKGSVSSWIFHLDRTTKSSLENRKGEKSLINYSVTQYHLYFNKTLQSDFSCNQEEEKKKPSSLGKLFLETENLILLFLVFFLNPCLEQFHDKDASLAAY